MKKSKKTTMRYVIRILQVLLSFMLVATVLNLVLLFAFQVPMIFPLVSFSTVRLSWFTLSEWGIVFKVLIAVILFVFVSSIVLVSFQKIIIPTIASLYILGDVAFLTYLFLEQLLVYAYFDQLYYLMLVWHITIFVLLCSYIIFCRREKKARDLVQPNPMIEE